MTSLPLAGLAPSRSQTARATVAGIGICLPEFKTGPLAAPVDLVGVSVRVQPDQGATTPALAARAARAALAAARAEASEIGLVVVGTTSPDVLWPSTACLVQAELALPMVGSFDLYAAEAGLLTALTVADRYVRAGTAAALVIGAESDSQLVRIPSDNETRQGCAASAVVLRAGTGAGGILASTAGGAPAPDGQSHDAVLLRGLARSVDECLKRAGLSLDGVDLVVADQTAPEIMRAWARAAGLPAARLFLDPERYWQAFVAAPFVALHDAVLEGRLEKGATALMLSCGRGPAWAVACLRWEGGGIRRC